MPRSSSWKYDIMVLEPQAFNPGNSNQEPLAVGTVLDVIRDDIPPVRGEGSKSFLLVTDDELSPNSLAQIESDSVNQQVYDDATRDGEWWHLNLWRVQKSKTAYVSMDMTLSDLRREIKPLGFKVSSKILSWGRHVTYHHIESGQALTFNVSSGEVYERWKPLFEYIKLHTPRLARLMYKEKIYGLSNKDLMTL